MASFPGAGERSNLATPEPRYNFICPNCAGNFAIELDRIPPVQARFRCPHCKEPMDFPSRDEARTQIRILAEAAAPRPTPAPRPATPTPSRPTPARPTPVPAPPPPPATDSTSMAAGGLTFRVEKTGFQSDVFDRKDIRNLIRTGEINESDPIRVDDSGVVPAGDLPYLKSLFNLAKAGKVQPPACCRTHTSRVAHFRCHDSGRPLCEPCAPEKKFGGATIRVCQHCGGTASDLHQMA